MYICTSEKLKTQEKALNGLGFVKSSSVPGSRPGTRKVTWSNPTSGATVILTTEFKKNKQAVVGIEYRGI